MVYFKKSVWGGSFSLMALYNIPHYATCIWSLSDSDSKNFLKIYTLGSISAGLNVQEPVAYVAMLDWTSWTPGLAAEGIWATDYKKEEGSLLFCLKNNILISIILYFKNIIYSKMSIVIKYIQYCIVC